MIDFSSAGYLSVLSFKSFKQLWILTSAFHRHTIEYEMQTIRWPRARVWRGGGVLSPVYNGIQCTLPEVCNKAKEVLKKRIQYEQWWLFLGKEADVPEISMWDLEWSRYVTPIICSLNVLGSIALLWLTFCDTGRSLFKWL